MKTLEIDFVSDVVCPWCAVGLHSLERALAQLPGDVRVNIRMQPFELNPDMPAAGVDAAEYLQRKYGMSAAQLAQNRANIRARGADVGFTFGERARVWNTFTAHRLLHWAGVVDAESSPAAAHQRALKHALLITRTAQTSPTRPCCLRLRRRRGYLRRALNA
jgi:predicted DsbA family dithiol-disulfide isomerase